MRVYHISRKRITLSALVMVALVVCLGFTLVGCQKTEDAAPGVAAGTDAERVAYLEGLGWQVDPEPIETLDLQLPADMTTTWADYAALQAGQDFPFADYAGKNVRRYTYRVNNYPAVTKGVQANLYVADDILVGGDIIATGQNGFQRGLAFPEAKKDTP